MHTDVKVWRVNVYLTAVSSQCVKFGQSYEILSCHLLKEVPIQSPEIFKRYRGSLDIISFVFLFGRIVLHYDNRKLWTIRIIDRKRFHKKITIISFVEK